MRKIITIILLAFTLYGYSNSYYIGAGGNNSNTGLSIAQRWLNVTKVNSSTFNSGDSILFASGQTFAGGLKIPSNGVIIASYGVGAKPIISGFVTLGTWSNVSPNIWECTPSQTLKSTCNVLTIDGNPFAVGRYPNNTYLTYQSANTTTLTSSSLTGTPNYTGAEVVMKKNPYIAEKARITGQSTNVITYTTTKQIDNNTPSAVNGTSGYGFFLQRFAGSLDQHGEWFYNSTTNKMQLYSTVNPSSLVVKASYIDTVIYIGTHTNVTVTNLAIEGASLYGIYSIGGTNVNIINCNFNNNTRAIYYKDGVNLTVSGNAINNSFCNAILAGQLSKQVNVLNNTITNTGLFLGMGLFWSSYDLKGIGVKTDTTSSSYINVIGNVVSKTSYMGIDFRGSNITVRKNVVDTFCFHLDDGGGIYTWINNTSVNNINYVNRIVDSNFISNCIGAPEGTTMTTIRGNGLYLDDQSRNIQAIHNTIWNIPSKGIILNNPLNIIVTDNTTYNCGYQMGINMKPYGPLTGNFVTRNIFYQKLNTQYNFYHINFNLSTPTPITITQSLQRMAFIDTNWIANTKTNAYYYYYSTNGSSTTFPPDFSLATWRSSYGHDIVSVLPPVTMTNTNTALYTNPTDSLRVVNFSGFRKRDPKGVTYDHQATIGRWSSLILIDDGNAPTGGNVAPTANAGLDQSITLPTNSTTLIGSGSDVDGTIAGYLWTKISGPAGGSITSSTSATTNITSLQQGTYVFSLRVTDNLGLTGTDFVQIVVSPANIAPTANAGTDQSITLPQNTATLSGSGSDPDGTISSYLWAKISGPSGGTITSSSSASTGITALQQGTYVFQLTVTDNLGLTGTDLVQIVINAANIAPTSNAGVDQSITLPTNTATLSGIGTDPDGTIASYLWTKISGPSGGIIASPSSAMTSITSLQQGTYVYQLVVSDNQGLTGSDFVQIVVNPAVVPPNVPPTANAGVDQAVTLPTNTATLSGSGADSDGTITGYLWRKISGPTGGAITSSTSATTGVTSLSAGVYVYQLRVTDNSGDTATDAMQLTVTAANIAPTANGGGNKAITLPINTTTLTGSGSDIDGTIVGYLWRKTSGPSGGTIASSTSATTNITGLNQGVYVFQFRVMDNSGDTATDAVQVTVFPANILPTANAGNDTTVVLPNNTATLVGSGVDPDGTITAYLWKKLSGPSGGTITSPTSATTGITGLLQGVYSYQLRVTGSSSDTATDVVQITVNPQPPLLPPVADAGIGQTIMLPQDTTELNGGSDDVDGTVNSYVWRKIAGPVIYNLVTPCEASTSVLELVAGTYRFELTVTDNDGLQGKDTVEIDVINQPVASLPIANAGDDLVTTDTTVTLNGGGAVENGFIESYLWTKISGSDGDVIESPNSASTRITGLTIGVYEYELTVFDGNDNTASDRVIITVVALGSNRTILRFYKIP